MSDEKKPLVTFALFAYNQEKFIREAVESAFSQDYESLEIIFSDDCSSDRTFEIMQEMAAKYVGPHRVKIRRSVANRGLGLHMMEVINIAAGAYVVVAAGDDVSLAERTSLLVGAMIREKAELAASNYNRISETSACIASDIKNDYTSNYLWRIVNADSDFFVNGAAAAYSIEFLRQAFAAASMTIQKEGLFNEDIFLSAFAVAQGSRPLDYTDGPLINYRINHDSLSNFSRNRGSLKSELDIVRRERFRSLSKLAILNAIEEIGNVRPHFRKKLNVDVIEHDRRLSILEMTASDPSVRERMRAFLLIESLADLKLVLVRVMGIKVHAIMRLVAGALFAI